jgi:type IV pilus assembly protein PilQ
MKSLVALALSLACLAAPAPSRATGKLLSLEMNGADIRSAIRVVAEVTKLNFVVDEEVTGKVTLKLRNVPWEEALKVILQSRELGMERSGSIVRVAPLRKFAEEKELALRIARAEKASAPLRTRIIPVNYARAEDMVAMVKATLSERGTVVVDARTNSLIVRDVE